MRKGLIVATFMIASVLCAGCSSSSRLTVTHRVYDPIIGLEIVKDNQTQKEYLVSTRGGIIELK